MLSKHFFMNKTLRQKPKNLQKNQCCGSGMFIPDLESEFFPSRIPAANFFHPGSRICIKELNYFNPKKWFQSSRNYDPGCSSRIRILDFYPSRIPGSKRRRFPDPRSGSATLIKTKSKQYFSEKTDKCYKFVLKTPRAPALLRKHQPLVNIYFLFWEPFLHPCGRIRI
jgi:hypothetical protein